MKPQERERIRQELLEYHFGCHEDPAQVEARLQSDPEWAAMLEEVRGTAALWQVAARQSVPELELQRPDVEDLTDAEAMASGKGRGSRVHWLPRLGHLPIAAGLLALIGLAALFGHWGWRSWRYHQAFIDQPTLMVEAPIGVPDAAPATLKLLSFNSARNAVARELEVNVFDGAGQVLSTQRELVEGEREWQLPPAVLASGRVLEVVDLAFPDDKISLRLTPDGSGPIAHLSTDKPVYRPGEIVRFRAVVLHRLSLEPVEGRFQMRIVDGRDAPAQHFWLTAENGVCWSSWQIPQETQGGRFQLQLMEPSGDLAVETQDFLIRRFDPPRLAKELQLDQESYAPGTEGSAELTVSALDGSTLTRAWVDASLIVDGETTWQEAEALDGSGRAVFRFPIPEQVAQGEARFVARIRHGGVLESVVEPFLIPIEGTVLDVQLYPEGGELVAIGSNRVYFEVFDRLARPLHAEGRIVDANDVEVARFRTEHQGRGAFEWRPEPGQSYRMEFDQPVAPPVALPDASTEGVLLRALQTGVAPGEALQLQVVGAGSREWKLVVFRSGHQVAAETLAGDGPHELELKLPEEVAGVLRVTVFDADDVPVAERLVHRQSGRGLVVDVEASFDRLPPGGEQQLQIRTRDESGQPVAAMVGISVSDRAVREWFGEDRIGLADQVWLGADVRKLEEVEEFFGEGEEVPRLVDLLLGTRGWRRFAWVNPSELLESGELGASEVLAREGVSWSTREFDTPARDMHRDHIRSLYRARSKSRVRVQFYGAILLLLSVLGAFALAVRKAASNPKSPFGVIVLFGTIGVVGFVIWIMTEVGMKGLAPGSDMAMTAESAPAMRSLGYVGDATGGEGFEQLGYAESEFEAPPEESSRSLLDDFDENELAPAQEVASEDAPNEPSEERQDDDGRASDLAELGYFEGDDLEVAARRASDSSQLSRRQLRIREYAHRHAGHEARRDFTETVYWNAGLITGKQGEANVRFQLSDRVTTWNVWVDAHGAGRVGQARTAFEAVLPFYLAAKLPTELTVGDELRIPVAVQSQTDAVSYDWRSEADPSLELIGPTRGESPLEVGQGRVEIPVRALQSGERNRLAIAAGAGRFRDHVQHDLRVLPRGFEHRESLSGVLQEETVQTIVIPDSHVAGSLQAALKLYPSQLASLRDSLEGLLQEPHGCFEQTSATHYPNVLVMSLLEAQAELSPSLARRTRDLLARGYERLTGFECRSKGYEWFGADPGHLMLTAYGLLEFADTAVVHEVDTEMMMRTRDWLLAHRTGEGGYRFDARGWSFGSDIAEVRNAYVSYALLAAGVPASELEIELALLERRSRESQDPYEVAVAACALAHAQQEAAADVARERLKRMQREDGALVGTSSTITQSRGRDLEVETTSFAVLAWLYDPEDLAPAVQAIHFLLASRSGRGSFGTTQATVMALKALNAYARVQEQREDPGRVEVFLNGEFVGGSDFSQQSFDPLRFALDPEALRPGENELRIRSLGGHELPWAFDLRYHAEQPANHPEAPLRITTGLARTELLEEETVSLQVELQNTLNEDLPMTMAIVGLPASLEAPTAVLDALKESAAIDFWETRGRELIFYWRGIKAEECKTLQIDLLARIPGKTTGPASRAYLYYWPEAMFWAQPLVVEVAADS